MLCVKDTKIWEHTAVARFTIYRVHLCIVVQLLTIVKEESESLAICKTQEHLFTDLGTERSSNCSTSASIQSLEKSSVAIQQNFFYLNPNPLH